MDEHRTSHEWPHEDGPLWLHPDDDLAPNRPGEHLHAKIASAELRGRAPTVLGAGLKRLAGRPDPMTAWRRSLTGHQAVGDALDTLTGGGWRVLHSVPLPSRAVLSHLLLGPAGCFTVRTESCGRGRVRVDRDTARAGRHGGEPCVRTARREAQVTSYALGRACGFGVEAQPVLAFAAPARLDVVRAPSGVLVTQDRDAVELGEGPAVWKPAEVETVYAVARDRRTWADLEDRPA